MRFNVQKMVIKILHVVLLASVKYFFTLPYAMIIGIDYFPAVIAVLGGGIGGFLMFFYLSKPVFRFFNRNQVYICALIPLKLKNRYRLFCERRKRLHKKIFTRKNRFIIRLKTTYGFWGIIIATPVLLTIPVGAFLASKYYSKRKMLIPYMILSIVGWAVVLSGFIHLFPEVFL